MINFISIHAPHTGRDQHAKLSSNRYQRFQSTRPIRGATLTPLLALSLTRYFNPRAPYGARHDIRPRITKSIHFNPRAPYGARLTGPVIQTITRNNFNPRAPYGARPLFNLLVALLYLFQSTRPIRGATTPSRHMRQKPQKNFNPRAPYGARPQHRKQ